MRVPYLVSLAFLSACHGKGDVDTCEPFPAPWYTDADGDGFGDPATEVSQCTAPEGAVQQSGDCDDGDPAVNPDAAEACNGVDDDCDGDVDQGFDADGDGHLATSCPGGDDCDDASEDVFPGAPDACGDGVDGDCDGTDPGCGVDVSLGDADAKVVSPSANDETGRYVELGDVNGDGTLDVVASTLSANGLAGGAWVVESPAAWADTDLATLGGHRLRGVESNAGAGRSLGIGDVNGDGYEDVAIGQPFGASCAEFVVYGPITGDVDLSSADVRLTAADGSFCGHGSDLVDLNDDGAADVVVGAYAADDGGHESGDVYVAYAPLSGSPIDLDASAGAKLIGEAASAWTGRVVKGAEDLDGDGYGDFVAGAIGSSIAGPSSGAAYVVYGPPTGTAALADVADGRLVGEAAYDYAGACLATADVNGDGLTDVVVGAQSSSEMLLQGAAYVVFGPASGDVPLGSADVVIRGDAENQSVGGGLAAADLDGDGHAEVLVGAPTDATAANDAGAAYLFLGLEPGVYHASDADVRVFGESEGDEAGWGPGLGDVTGDGDPEMIVGVPRESTGGTTAGALYLVSTGF